MRDKKSTATGGVGFFGLLALLFIGLKLTGYIDWSWWWILSPLWGSCGCFIVVILIVGIIMLIVEVLER